jgi:hypothetical protein
MWDVAGGPGGPPGFEERAADALAAWWDKRFELPDYYPIMAAAQPSGTGPDLYLGPLRAARPRRVAVAGIAGGPGEAARVLDTLRSLEHAPWWPPLDELIDAARRFYAGGLTEAQPAPAWPASHLRRSRCAAYWPGHLSWPTGRGGQALQARKESATPGRRLPDRPTAGQAESRGNRPAHGKRPAVTHRAQTLITNRRSGAGHCGSAWLVAARGSVCSARSTWVAGRLDRCSVIVPAELWSSPQLKSLSGHDGGPPL